MLAESKWQLLLPGKLILTLTETIRVHTCFKVILTVLTVVVKLV